MDNVELVGVHDDGEHLLLVGPDGRRFLLGIDDALRAAVRRDRARLGQLQIAIAGSPRPQEIQRRIRAGMSARAVAEASGLPLEHVLRYEGPVMAEREHVARRARSTVVQRTGSSATPLEDLVSQRLTARGVEGTPAWDAWREDTGSWVVQVSFSAGGRDRAARWRYDIAGAHLEPMEDEARWLTARTEQEAGPLGGRRLSAVKVQEKVYDVEADGGVRPSGRDAVEQEPPRDRTVELLDALRGRRGRRQPVLEGDEAPTQGDLVDELLEQSEAPPAAHPPASRPEQATDAEILTLPEPRSDQDPEAQGPDAEGPDAQGPDAQGPDAQGPDAQGPEAQGPDAQDPEAQDPEAQDADDGGEQARGEDSPDRPQDQGGGRPGSRRQARSRSTPRRASVPSWDDIVFGSKKD